MGGDNAEIGNKCNVCGRGLVNYFDELSCSCSVVDSVASGGQVCLPERSNLAELDSNCQAQSKPILELKIVDQVKDDDDGLDQVVIGNGAGATEFVHVLSEQF